MTAQQGDDYETLIQFLYQAPIGLIQTARTGDICMMNPMAAQLLMPLAPQGDLDNLFDIFQGVAPQLRELLRRIAARLSSVLRPQDSLDSGFARPPTAARLGSDEFAVLLEDLYSVDDARSVGQRLVDLVGEPYRVDGRQIDVSVSVGIVPGNRAIGHADEVLHNASIAMRWANSC
jgi:GGDEF domain-containing protein